MRAIITTRNGDVGGLAEPPERGARLHVRGGDRVGRQVARRAGHDLAGGHGVAHDPVAAVLDGDLAGHLDQAALADRVGEVARHADHAVL